MILSASFDLSLLRQRESSSGKLGLPGMLLRAEILGLSLLG